MAVIAGIKGNILTSALKKNGMSNYEALLAKNIAEKTSYYENVRINITYSKDSGVYTIITK